MNEEALCFTPENELRATAEVMRILKATNKTSSDSGLGVSPREQHLSQSPRKRRVWIRSFPGLLIRRFNKMPCKRLWSLSLLGPISHTIHITWHTTSPNFQLELYGTISLNHFTNIRLEEVDGRFFSVDGVPRSDPPFIAQGAQGAYIASGKYWFCLLTLERAYCDLMTLLSRIKPKVAKPDCA